MRALAIPLVLLFAVPVAFGPSPGAGVLGDVPAPALFGAHHENEDPTGRIGAGPAAIAHGAGGVPVAYAGPVALPRLYTTGGLPLEPSLGIRPGGELVTVMSVVRETPLAGATTLRSGYGPAVLRSSDGGVTWEAIHQLHPSTQDPYVHVDPATGRIFTADFLGCMAIAFSDDAEAWTETTHCGWTLDHQTLFTGPARSATHGYPRAVYLCAIGGGLASGLGSLVTCSRSADGGLTWTPTGEPAFEHVPAQLTPSGETPCYAGSGHGHVTASGVVLVPRGHCGQPWLAISDDEGATWRRVQVASNGIPLVGHEADVVSDEAGNLYYSWVAADLRPYLAISRDGGATWSAPMDLAPPGVQATALPAMAIGDGGALAFAYMATYDTPSDDAWWHAIMTITTDALAAEPVFLSTTLNDPVDPLVVGECGPLRCQAQYDFLDVQVAPDGRPWAVFADGCDLAIDCGGPTVKGHAATLDGVPLRG